MALADLQLCIATTVYKLFTLSLNRLQQIRIQGYLVGDI